MPDRVRLTIDGRAVEAEAGTSVLAALWNAGLRAVRSSVSEQGRGPLCGMGTCHECRVTIDGADEVDPQFNLIKGGGGALLREKMVAQASVREIIVVDERKLSDAIGTLWPLPIEVVEFSWAATARFLRSIGGEPELRHHQDGAIYTTDQRNLILDTAFGPIDDPAALAAILEHRAGIVEHGMFLNLTDEVIVAGSGGVRHIKMD